MYHQKQPGVLTRVRKVFHFLARPIHHKQHHTGAGGRKQYQHHHHTQIYLWASGEGSSNRNTTTPLSPQRVLHASSERDTQDQGKANFHCGVAITQQQAERASIFIANQVLGERIRSRRHRAALFGVILPFIQRRGGYFCGFLTVTNHDRHRVSMSTFSAHRH